MRLVLQLLIYCLQIYVWLIIIRAILSWIRIRPTGIWLKIVQFIAVITEPVLRVFRRIIPSIRIGRAYLDISFIVAVLAIQLIIFLLRLFMFNVII